MFPTRKRIVLLHPSGKVNRATTDHSLFVQGHGRVNAADLPGAENDSEQEVVYHLNLGVKVMLDQPCPNYLEQ